MRCGGANHGDQNDCASSEIRMVKRRKIYSVETLFYFIKSIGFNRTKRFVHPIKLVSEVGYQRQRKAIFVIGERDTV